MTHSRLGSRKTAQGTRIRITLLVIILASVCFFVTKSWGQGAVATVVGKVVDSSGAVVPDATVTVTNVGTNVVVSTKTTSAGDFTVSYLKPGLYRVVVEATGFQKAEVQGITLLVNQTARADVALKLGMETQTVSVNASAVALDTDSSAVGQVITENQIVDLPMQNRSFNNLLLLAPGATNAITDTINSIYMSNQNINVGGARGSSNGFLIDGMTNTEPYYTQPAVQLSLDAIQEFKEQQSTYSAQYGASASQINLSTKYGTNKLHGTLFEFIRNDAFDALTFFDPPNAKNPPLRQNDYGYSLGGPVYIPKLYNGRDSSFFFANFERLKASTSSVAYPLAPTSNEVQGIVSSTVPILDPLTGKPFSQDNSGNYIIPTARWSRLASVTTKVPGDYFAVAGSTIINGGNAVVVITDPSFTNQQTYRLDRKFGLNDSLAARFTLTNGATIYNTYDRYGGQSLAGATTQSWNVIETHSFSANLVNQARVGWLHYFLGTVAVAAPSADLSALGLQNTFPQAGTSFPSVSVSGIACCGGAFGLPSAWTESVWNGEDSISWVHGKHTVTLGFLAYLNYDVVDFITSILGQWSYDGSITAPAGAAPTPDNAWADFLLGTGVSGEASVPTAYAQTNPFPVGLYMDQKKFAGYMNDDFKASNRLTLNVGLRYDFQSNPVEENHRQFWRDLAVPGGALCTPDRTLITSGVGGAYYNYCTRSTPKAPFAPRLGFAFRPFPSDKTVVRGGYGIFFDQYQLYEFTSGDIYPFVGQFNSGHYSFNNMFPTPTQSAITGALLSSLLNLEPPVMKNPYLQDWSLSVQQELTRNTKLDVAYVGSKGTHLETRLMSSQPTSYNPADPAAGYPLYNFGTFGQNGTPLSPGEALEGAFPGTSNYNALQISVDHRAKDLALLAAYTWSSAMDDTSASGGTAIEATEWQGPMDAHNIHLDYSKSSYDINRRFVASFVYELPLGRGKQFGSGMGKTADAVVGGWQVNGIYSDQSGLPFNTISPDLGFALQSYGQRSNVVGNPHPPGFHKSYHQWFDTSAFSQPAMGSFGNERRNDLRAPGLNNLDFSLFKNFAFGDRAKLQIRGEAFNALNHAQIGAPDPNRTDASFGLINSTWAPGRIVQLAAKVIF